MHEMCPIGALLLGKDAGDSGFIQSAAKELGVTDSWVIAFYRGFDSGKGRQSWAQRLGAHFRYQILGK